jgi:hypothetical protein
MIIQHGHSGAKRQGAVRSSHCARIHVLPACRAAAAVDRGQASPARSARVARTVLAVRPMSMGRGYAKARGQRECQGASHHGVPNKATMFPRLLLFQYKFPSYIPAKQMNTKSGFGPDARLPQMSGIALRLKGAGFSPATVSAMWRLDQARALDWPLGFAANRRYSLAECQSLRGLGVGINADSPIFCSGLRWCLPVRALSPHAQVWRGCRSRQVACRRTRRSVRRSLRPFRRSMTCRHPGKARS